MIKKITTKIIYSCKKSYIIYHKYINENNHTIKIKVNSIPKHEKTNQKIIKIISNYFKIPTSKIKISYGKHSKNKLLIIY